MLRPLKLSDFSQWSEVRIRNRDWLLKWEPKRKDPINPDLDRNAFALRCSARDRDWQSGAGFGFGVFVDGDFIGEANLNNVQRGPFQNANLGYWIDERHAGNGYIPESCVLLMKFAFEVQMLHRLEVAIVPRNAPSLRVVEKLGLRFEGMAKNFLEINGVWEDHNRYAITFEDWIVEGDEFVDTWL